MSVNRHNIGSDLAKVDAHAIQAEEYDEAPEFTDEMFERGKWSEGGKPIPSPKKRGRPPVDTPKVHVTARLDADVVHHFKAGGKGWQGRMNQALRDAMVGRTVLAEGKTSASPSPNRAAPAKAPHKSRLKGEWKAP